MGIRAICRGGICNAIVHQGYGGGRGRVRVKVRVRCFVVTRGHTGAVYGSFAEWYLGYGLKGGCAACCH